MVNCLKLFDFKVFFVYTLKSLNMRLRMYPSSVTVEKMTGIFTKHIGQPFIRLKRVKPRAPDFRGPQNFWSKDHFQHFGKQLYLFVCFGSRHIFWFGSRHIFCFGSRHIYAAIKRHLKKILREELKWMTMSILFLWRWELVIFAYIVRNKTLLNKDQLLRNKDQ